MDRQADTFALRCEGPAKRGILCFGLLELSMERARRGLGRPVGRGVCFSLARPMAAYIVIPSFVHSMLARFCVNFHLLIQ